MTHPRTANEILAHRYRVVIADDDEGARAVLTTALEQVGFEVTQAHDGEELLHILGTVPRGFFKLAIADHRVPQMHGSEVRACAAARAPLVVITEHESPELRTQASKLGAIAVLTKPVDLHVLLELTEAVATRNGT
jgi:DNA-binding response OmpR family regulator